MPSPPLILSTMKETRIAFSGSVRGVARLHADSANTRIQVRATEGALPEGCTAWLCADTLLPLPLTNGIGSAAQAVAAPVGLLLEAGGHIVGTGGFAGRESDRREAALRVRLQARPQQSRPAEAQTPPAPTPPAREPTPAAAPVHAAEPPAEPTRRETPTPPAQPSAALQNILRMAEYLFPPQQAAQEAAQKQSAPPPLPYIPFPTAYPGTAFRKVSYPGSQRFYLEGRVKNGAVLYELHAMQGNFAPVPPVPGFTQFLRAEDGTGYWIRRRPIRG